MTFGCNLKKMRKEHGLTQADLASILGMAKGTVSVWERDVRLPEMKTIDMLCSMFSVSRGELIGEPAHYANHEGIPASGMDGGLSKETKEAMTKYIRALYKAEREGGGRHEG